MTDVTGGSRRVHLGLAFAMMSLIWFGLSYDVPFTFPAQIKAGLISVVYDSWALGAGLLAVGWSLAIRRRSARHPAMAWHPVTAWLPLAISLLTMAVGDTIWDLSRHGLIPVPKDTPSLMDLFYLPAYLAFGLNVMLLVRRYHPRGPGPLLETVVVAVSAAAGAFPLLAEPYAGTIGHGPPFARLMNLLYPVSDVMLFAAMVVVLFASPQVRALRYVAGAAGLCMIADYIYARQEAAGTYTGLGWLDWLWLLQYTLMAVAVLSPVPEPDPDAWHGGVVRRSMLLIGATLLCPALTVAVRFGMPVASRAESEAIYSIATLGLIALVSARLVGLLRENQHTVASLRSALAERAQLSQDLDHQANHDAVTGLPNRRMLMAQAAGIVRAAGRPDESGATPQGRSHAILFIDLDDFTAINDSFGPGAGDVVLRAVAGRLLAVAGPSDLVARLGGDEFAVFLPGRGEDGAQAIASRVLDVIGAPLPVAGKTLSIGASAGIALIGQAADHPGSAVLDGLVQADVAMYAAKRAGRKQVLVYTEAMRDQVLGDASLAADLVLAISAAELDVHYQPIVDLGSGMVAAVEALVRWEHPERGRLAPDLFLPIAQARGIIADLDLLVIESALDQLTVWRQKQPRLRVAVNASAQLLARPDVVQVLLADLAVRGLPGSALIVEVTEQSVIDDSERAARCLEELRQHGVSVALDDFGTGYSSLSYLQQLPVDVLKLDQSFIDRGISETGLSPLLRAVIELGHELGVAVVAEGIETQSQLQELERVGCERGQGWLFAKAVPPEEVSGYLEIVLPGTRPARAQLPATHSPA